MALQKRAHLAQPISRNKPDSHIPFQIEMMASGIELLYYMNFNLKNKPSMNEYMAHTKKGYQNHIEFISFLCKPHV